MKTKQMFNKSSIAQHIGDILVFSLLIEGKPKFSSHLIRLKLTFSTKI